jgi:NADH dehydrogenase
LTKQESPGISRGEQVNVWTTGFSAPNLAARSGLSTDARGRLLTDDTLTSIEDVQPAAADVGFVGECISLGCRAGVVQFARRDDSAIGLHLGGRPGSEIKELVCRSTVALLAREAKKPGARNVWFKDPQRRTRLQDQPAATLPNVDQGFVRQGGTV